MHRLLNIIEKLLTMVLAVTYIFSFPAINYPFIIIILFVLSVFTFCTSIVDIVRFKNKDIKITVLSIVLLLILLLNIYRPFIDSLLIKHLSYDFQTAFTYSVSLLRQNVLLVTIFVIILFILNFKLNKKH